MQLPKNLVEAYRRFLRDQHAPKKGRYIQLAELSQTTTAMVIACCDGRVDVSAIFDAEPGALFIMRNIANLVPPRTREGNQMQMSSRQRIEIAADAIFNEFAAMFQADMRRILSERAGVELSEDEYRLAIQKALGAAQNRTATLVGTS